MPYVERLTALLLSQAYVVFHRIGKEAWNVWDKFISTRVRFMDVTGPTVDRIL